MRKTTVAAMLLITNLVFGQQDLHSLFTQIDLRSKNRTSQRRAITSSRLNDDATTILVMLEDGRFVMRKLNEVNGAPVGESKVFQFNPASRLSSLSATKTLPASQNLVERLLVSIREQRNLLAAPNGKVVPQSAVFTIVFDSNLNPLGQPKQVSPWKNTGNANAELFRTVSLHPEGDYIVYSEYSNVCRKLIFKFRELNSDGSAKGAPRTLLNCADLTGSSVGVIGTDVIDTFLAD